eukprot:1077206_1
MSWPPLQDGADEVTMMDVAAGLGQKRKLSPEPSANTAANIKSENDEFEEPPLKKQKLSTETEIDMDSISCKPALILFPSSFALESIDHLCSHLTQSEFNIIRQKTMEMATDQFEQLFIECSDSSICTVDMISNGMYDAFCSDASLSIILVSSKAKDIYKTLKVFSKSYGMENTQQSRLLYFTLNNDDYLYKSKLLFTDNDDEHVYMYKHSLFWKRMHSNHGTFIGSNHSTENESNLNAFYDETQQVLEIERTAAQIKCCCIPIELYLDRDHRERYRERIENEGLNALARQWYQQSIERSNDGTFRRSRDRVRKHCVDIDKVREMIKLIQCNHALNKYLQEMFDKKDIDLLEYF